jgi:hypothetical protein
MQAGAELLCVRFALSLHKKASPLDYCSRMICPLVLMSARRTHNPSGDFVIYGIVVRE